MVVWFRITFIVAISLRVEMPKLSSVAWCGILAIQYVESENAISRTRLWKPEVNCDTLTVHLTWGDRFGSCFLRDSSPRVSRYLKFAEEMRDWIRLYFSDSGCKLAKPCQWSLGFSISQKDEYRCIFNKKLWSPAWIGLSSAYHRLTRIGKGWGFENTLML